jgi:hypothetical protein
MTQDKHLFNRPVTWAIGFFTLAAISASVLYVTEGFGAGHGRFDQVYIGLGLPCNLLVLLLPEGVFGEVSFMTDWGWLIAIPFALNVLLTFMIAALAPRFRKRVN